MSSMKVMNKRLRWFVKEMQGKLRLNLYKTDARHLSRRAIKGLLNHEVDELSVALREEWFHADMIIKECADIANYAMMLADKVYYQKKKGNK